MIRDTVGTHRTTTQHQGAPMNITRQQAEDLTAFIATMTPTTDAEQALADRATSNPTQVTGDILTTPNTVAATSTDGTVDTYDLFSPAQLDQARASRRKNRNPA